MSYRAVLFDMDDTLIKTWESKWAHYKLVGKRYYGLDITDEKLGKHWGEPFPTLVKSIFGESTGVEEAIQNFLRHEKDFPKPPHDGVADIMQTLLDAGLRLGVITAMLTHVAENDLRNAGLELDRLDILQGADQTMVHKPDPLVFEPALLRLEEMGIKDKKSVLYVGDALSDFYAAQGAGLDFVGVTTGFVDKASFKDAGAEKVIKSLAELPALVLKKDKK